VRKLIVRGAIIGFVIGSLLPLALTGCGSRTKAESANAQESKRQFIKASDVPGGSGKGMTAIQQAAAAGKYLFLFFSKIDDDQTQAMRKVFDKAMERVADRAQWIAVDVNDASEKAVVTKFDLGRAPMPLVLVLAPNGAITGGFPRKVEEQQLVDAFATPVTEKVMKHLQDGKLVFVCVQNGKTKSNDAALQGVRDFKAASRFAGASEIVMLDPTDSAEAPFLADLKIESNAEEAVTVFMAPPGSVIEEYKGATDKAQLVATLQKASSGCAGGQCGPGGCGPR